MHEIFAITSEEAVIAGCELESITTETKLDWAEREAEPGEELQSSFDRVSHAPTFLNNNCLHWSHHTSPIREPPPPCPPLHVTI